jgi:hypothetical protein
MSFDDGQTQIGSASDDATFCMRVTIASDLFFLSRPTLPILQPTRSRLVGFRAAPWSNPDDFVQRAGPVLFRIRSFPSAVSGKNARFLHPDAGKDRITSLDRWSRSNQVPDNSRSSI